MLSKRKIVVILILIMTLGLAGGHVREEYKLLHPADEISAVEIVTVLFDEEGIADLQVKACISDVKVFMKDFRLVPCYVYFGDPIGLKKNPSGIDVIRITYQNGDYELIDYNGQSEYTQERGFDYYAGFNVFDEEQFEELIEKYSSVT